MLRTLAPNEPTPRSRRGFALALAMFGIVVIGAIVAGVFYASTQDYRLSRNQLVQERALAVAEYGLNRVVAEWDLGNNTRLLAGDTLTKVYNVNGDVDSVWVTKLNTYTFWVVSVGRSGSGIELESRRRVNQIFRLNMPDIRMEAALNNHGASNIAGSGTIDGTDITPPGWNCPPTGPQAAGVAAPPSGTMTSSGSNCSSFACVTGNPKVLYDNTLTDTSKFSNWNSLNWSQLVAMKNITLAAGTVMNTAYGKPQPQTSNGLCDTSRPSNWGDPNRASPPGLCESYFPIIYAAGDLSLSNGSGQGILLVEGNLTITGQFTWYGPVIIRGSLTTSGTGMHIVGGIMAGNFNGTTNSISGTPTLQFSRCALTTVFQTRVYPVPAKDHGWAAM